MEFINGNCTLTKREHKAFVKFLFEQSRAEAELLDIFRDIGLVTTEGPLAKLAFDAFDCLKHITPENVAERDGFCDEFIEASNFEKFYKKYYKGEF